MKRKPHVGTSQKSFWKPKRKQGNLKAVREKKTLSDKNIRLLKRINGSQKTMKKTSSK